MPDGPVVLELKQILGAMIFSADRPLSTRDMVRCLQEVAERDGEETAVFAEVDGRDVRRAVKELQHDLEALHPGFALAEVAGGFRIQTDSVCGRWVRQLLKKGKPNRLSRPALETLAIIAYRQPIAKSEIESVRGVSVGHVVKALMEMHLVRIVGRSDLPGRPFLYGTTASFLGHFGLKNLNELNDMDPTLQRSDRKQRRAAYTKAKPVEAEEAPEADGASTSEPGGAVQTMMAELTHEGDAPPEPVTEGETE